MEMKKKLRVGVLGATGMVGQRFITLLAEHPWYEVTAVAASPRSAGRTYEEAVGGRWKMQTPMPESVKNMVVMNVNEVEKVAEAVDFVFSAVDMTKEEIRAIEDAYAKAEIPVVSNNSAHRWTPDVPMVVPEINPEHFGVIEFQKKRLGTTRGFVAVKPNCSIQSYAPVLTAWKEFEPYEVVATTYQAISGAGKTFGDWPEMVENIIPYIGGDSQEGLRQRPVLRNHDTGQVCRAYLDSRLQIQPCRHPGGPDPSGGLHAGAASGRTTHPDGRSGHFLHSYQQHGSRITGDIQSRHPCGRPERALESRDPFPQLAERQRIQPGPYPKGCQAGG